MSERVSTPSLTLLQSALAHHQQGRLDEAECLYRQVLEFQPHQQDALRLLGVLCRQRGDLETARELLEIALRFEPHIADTHHDLGLVWFELRRYVDAVAAYQRALRIRWDFPEAHYNLGNAYYALSEIDLAAASYREAINQRLDLPEVHFNLGLLEQDRRNDSAAVIHYENALRLRPHYPEALLNLGLTQSSLGQLQAAGSTLHKALALKPEYIEAWLNLGDVLQRAGALGEAESCFRHAIALRPSNVPAHLNLSVVLNGLGKVDDAEKEARTAVGLDQENPRAHAYLGGLLLKNGPIEEAIACSNQALSLDPNFIPARVTLSQALLIRNDLDAAARAAESILELNNSNVSAHTCLGIVRSRQRRPWEALGALERAISLDPNDWDAMINLAICELLLGRYIAGWKHYEARWTTQLTFCVPRRFTQPRWNGEDFDGRTLLLYGEQGFGDTIQFVRYARLAAKLGGRVIVECQPSLKSLLKGVAGADQVFGYGEPLPEFDLQAPVLSLPGVFQTIVETIPSSVPYIYAPSDVTAQLPAAPRTRLKVGLVWCGSRSQNHDPRPVPFRRIEPLLSLEGIAFYSFQTGEMAAELQQTARKPNIFDLSSQLADFSVTASFVEQLDLVISIDTALAHLAGAMGKRVWVLLPFAPDWRWALEGERCPWYPTMQLFRQSESGNWSESVSRVVHELQLLAENRT